MPIRTPFAAATLLCLAVASAADAGDLRVDGKLISDAPQGTAPLEVGSTTTVGNLSADLLDGFEAADFLPAAGNVLLVAKSGGHFTSIQAALASIVGAGPTNTFLVLVAPGVYVEQVTMRPYVDILGSGQGVTTISWAGGDLAQETLLGADLAELRDLTVENTGGGQANPWAIRNVTASPRLTRVTVYASTTASGATAVRNEGGSAPLLTDVVAIAEGDSAIAIHNLSGRLVMKSGEAHAVGENAIAFANQATEGAVLQGVVISGTTSTGSGNARAISSTAGTLEAADVVASASGASVNTGIHAQSSSADLELTRVTVLVEGEGGNTCFGVRGSGGDVVLRHGDVSVSGCATTNYGVQNDNGATAISHSAIAASSGTTSIGIHSFAFNGPGPCTAEIHASEVSGELRSVSSEAGCTSRIGASRLGGSGTGGAGTDHCAGVYDDATSFHASTCP